MEEGARSWSECSDYLYPITYFWFSCNMQHTVDLLGIITSLITNINIEALDGETRLR